MISLKNFKTKAFSMGLAIATAASLAAPLTANAAASNYVVAPADPIEADADVATVAAHRAAETAPQFLGANLTTTQTTVNNLAKAKASNVFNIFGSIWNQNPDTYLWNYYYNMYAADWNASHDEDDALVPASVNVVALMTQTVGPTNADLSGVSLSTNPDIFLGNGYPAGYNAVEYYCNDLEQMIESMYRLADGMNAVPRTVGTNSGRYGDPEDIADNYQLYIKGVQYYITSKLQAEMAEDIEKILEENPDADVDDITLSDYMKKVAIVGVNNDGTYKLYDSNMSSGTAASCRAAEYLECSTANVIDALKAQGINTDSVSAAQLKASGAEFIFTSGVQGNGTLTATLTDADAIPAGAVVVDQLPGYVYGISMNSVENALGVAIFQSIVYEDYLNIEDAVAYFYANFYHLNQNMIDIVADDYFANFAQYGYEASKYNLYNINKAVSNFESVLNAGKAYYEDNATYFANTKLAWYVH